jgi:choline dehydrogenase-like flavoprotein
MATNSTSQTTDFTRDVIGRFVCNGLDEALRSADQNLRADARPFDIIVIGGGTFGAALAQHLFFADKTHSHRILVLEGGPVALSEHVQNMPLIGLNPPPATSIADLRRVGQDRIAQNEVWGLAWHSSHKFPGLAYCVGGRSLFWGGWSPQPLATELPLDQWPSSVVNDLNSRYFRESSVQIGVNETNDFIQGDLHEALRKQLFEGINAGNVTDAVAFAQLPLHLDIPGVTAAVGAAAGGAGASSLQPTISGAASDPNADVLKLEAPLAVQSRTRPGFFPFNKFSSIPLLVKATRAAWTEANGDDFKKRLMIVPNCHVKRMNTFDGRVASLDTNLGPIPVQGDGAVIVALGTIESTRLALLSLFKGVPGEESVLQTTKIGRNLMAHLRSNLTIRVPRTALPVDPLIKELQASALFVKGRHQHDDGTLGHFHLQITAAGLGALGTDSEAELFKKVPDLDTFGQFDQITDSHVVITIRGIGEMESQNINNFVTLDSETDEYGMRRAFVALVPTAKDLALWDAMDKAADDVAKVFAAGEPVEILGKQRDGLGTTHHEAGSMWMGDDASTSVTNPDGRLHHLDNAYVAGPALFPTIGSPNPMLSGIALARRLGNHLATQPAPVVSPGFTLLFDGVSTGKWRMSTIKNQPGRDNPGTFSVVNGALEAVTGTDIGLFWHTVPTPPDFILKLEWLRWREDDNSGIFVRFPDPQSKGYNNTAFVAVDCGFEVQIDQRAVPDGAAIHKTGAIYNFAGPQNPDALPVRPIGEWNEFQIHVKGQNYKVLLNGQQITEFQNDDPNRGLPGALNAPSFIGLQTHTGRVSFRNIQIKAI